MSNMQDAPPQTELQYLKRIEMRLCFLMQHLGLSPDGHQLYNPAVQQRNPNKLSIQPTLKDKQ